MVFLKCCYLTTKKSRLVRDEDCTMTDRRFKYGEALKQIAASLGVRVEFSVKHGHLAGEVHTSSSNDPGLDILRNVDALIEVIEIATAHICPSCGIESSVINLVDHPGGDHGSVC